MGKSTINIDTTSEVLDDGSGYVHEGGQSPFKRKQKSPKYRARLAEAYALFGAAMKGNPYAMLDLREAFSTDDFPLLFGDIMSRELLPQYRNAPSMWTAFTRRTVVRDFRPHKLIDLLGGQGILDEVPELTEYKARSLQEFEYQLRVRKHGNRFALSWESFINDDLDGLRDLPNRLAVSARRSEDRHAVSLLFDEDGPLSSFWMDYADDDDNPLTIDNRATEALMGATASGGVGPNPQLSVDSLSKALEVVQSRRDVDDAPLIIDGFILMVPPALEQRAQMILNATELRVTEGDTEIIVGNWLRGRITLVVNPWMPVVDRSANANTTWLLLPAPSSPRPAVVLGFLRGYETPDLRLRSSDSERLGGGSVPGEEGSFDNDDVQYRVRHVFGGSHVDPFATFISLGNETEWS